MPEPDARKAVVMGALREAWAEGAPVVEAEHILLALASLDGSRPQRILAEAGLDHAALREAQEREFEHSLRAAGVLVGDFVLPRPAPPAGALRKVSMGASARLALQRAASVATGRGARRIGATHLLIGVLRAEVGTVPRMLALADADRVALASRGERELAADVA
jgi:D-alanyl-D-alanine carboxypeptidase